MKYMQASVEKKIPRFMGRLDIWVIAAFLLLAAAGWGLFRLKAGGKPAAAEIYLGSELVETIPLDGGEERTFSVPGKENVVFHLYEDGSIAFEQSDCPDQICVRSGRLNRPGETAVCLPNQLILKIVSPDGGGEHDIVV